MGKNRYQLVNGQQLAKFILHQEKNVEFGFATTYETSENGTVKHAETWYSIVKTRIFDGNLVLVGYQGGGDVLPIDIDNNHESLGDALSRYISDITSTDDGMVCLDLEDKLDFVAYIASTRQEQNL